MLSQIEHLSVAQSQKRWLAIAITIVVDLSQVVDKFTLTETGNAMCPVSPANHELDWL